MLPQPGSATSAASATSARITRLIRSLQFQVRLLHDVAPLLDLGGKKRAEIARGFLEQGDPDAVHLFARRSLREYRPHIARDPLGHRSVDRCGSEETLPQRGLVFGQALLGD